MPSRWDPSGVTIVVPARNEAPDIGLVLHAARPFGDDLLVVDGHSTDGTPEIARAAGARVVRDGGRGKGDAVRTGIREARGDVVVFLDADCSHDPGDIPLLVAPIREGRADHVTASRVLGGSEERTGDLEKLWRALGSDVITLGINYRYGVALTDSQNGFRAMGTRFAQSLPLTEDGTTIEQQILICALARGGRVCEVPSHEYARRSGRSTIHLRRVAPRYVWSWLRDLGRHPAAARCHDATRRRPPWWDRSA